MNPWELLPFVRLIIPLITGILSGIKIFPDIIVSNNLLLCLLGFSVVIIVFPGIFISYRSRWLFGTIAFIFLFLTGIKLSQTRSSENNPFYFAQYNAKADYYVADISEPLSEKNKSYKTILNLCAISLGDKWLPAKGKICAYFRKDSTAPPLQYGDRIIFRAFVNDIDPPKNPYEFDYGAYLASNNIYHQVYLSGESFFLINEGEGNPLFSVAFMARHNLLNSLSCGRLDGDEYAVAAALLLGYKDELGHELRSAYSAAGAMHILCVSGLHVGVVFIVLNTLLGSLRRIRFGRVLQMILLLITIWFYAFITGLSPSVLRASCMISLVIVSKSLNRYVNIYNSLAASAFILLLIDPYILFNIGFQLSYLAVTGIVSSYKYMYDLWSPRFIITEKIWSIVAVSVAAQLGTFPLSLYYFHQFPNLFLLTNILVIPLSSVIIYSGMAAFVFSATGQLHTVFLEVLSFFVRMLNYIINMIDQIEFSSTQNIYLNGYGTLIIYCALIFLVIYLNAKREKYLVFAGIAVILFLGINIYQKAKSYDQKYIFVYNIRGFSAIDFVSGRNNCFIADTVLLSDKKKEVH